MLWIALVVGWLAVASLVAWLMGTAVARSDRVEVPCPPNEATADAPCPRGSDVEADVQPEIAAAR